MINVVPVYLSCLSSRVDAIVLQHFGSLMIAIMYAFHGAISALQGLLSNLLIIFILVVRYSALKGKLVKAQTNIVTITRTFYIYITYGYRWYVWTQMGMW